MRNSLCLFMSCFVQHTAHNTADPSFTQPSHVSYQWSSILGSLLLLHATQTRGRGPGTLIWTHTSEGCAEDSENGPLCAGLAVLYAECECVPHCTAPLLLPISCREILQAFTSPSCVMWSSWTVRLDSDPLKCQTQVTLIWFYDAWLSDNCNNGSET